MGKVLGYGDFWRRFCLVVLILYCFFLGVLFRGRVRCSWYGVCFNISIGDLEDFFGLDSLYKF